MLLVELAKGRMDIRLVTLALTRHLASGAHGGQRPRSEATVECVGKDIVVPMSHEAQVQSLDSGEVPFSHSPLEITLVCVHGGRGGEAGRGPSGGGKSRDTADLGTICLERSHRPRSRM
jgi:hypothetical protein